MGVRSNIQAKKLKILEDKEKTEIMQDNSDYKNRSISTNTYLNETKTEIKRGKKEDKLGAKLIDKGLKTEREVRHMDNNSYADEKSVLKEHRKAKMQNFFSGIKSAREGISNALNLRTREEKQSNRDSKKALSREHQLKKLEIKNSGDKASIINVSKDKSINNTNVIPTNTTTDIGVSTNQEAVQKAKNNMLQKSDNSSGIRYKTPLERNVGSLGRESEEAPLMRRTKEERQQDRYTSLNAKGKYNKAEDYKERKGLSDDGSKGRKAVEPYN